jgi:hypothetical protein
MNVKKRLIKTISSVIITTEGKRNPFITPLIGK